MGRALAMAGEDADAEAVLEALLKDRRDVRAELLSPTHRGKLRHSGLEMG